MSGGVVACVSGGVGTCHVSECVRACMHACVRACVRACVHACVVHVCLESKESQEERGGLEDD